MRLFTYTSNFRVALLIVGAGAEECLLFLLLTLVFVFLETSLSTEIDHFSLELSVLFIILIAKHRMDECR